MDQFLSNLIICVNVVIRMVIIIIIETVGCQTESD